MTEEQAFLMAILERPDDDSTKLVYADWLEEQGDPRYEDSSVDGEGASGTNRHSGAAAATQ